MNIQRIYPGLIYTFEQRMNQPLLLKKEKVLGTDLRDPVSILRKRLHLLLISKPQAVSQEPLSPAAVLVFSEPETPALTLQETSTDNIEVKNSSVPPYSF